MSAPPGQWRRARLATARLYLCVGIRPDLERFLGDALGGGVDVVQLRDKDADRGNLAEAAVVFRALAREHAALFVVNDDPQLAAEVDADGVHVGQQDASPAEARALVGPERLVGRSTHSVAEVDAALAEDCDYFAVGPVHATPTKEGRPGIGLDPVSHAARVADRPWFVTGGMAVGTVPDVLRAGGRRVVVVRAIAEAAAPGLAAEELATLLARV